MTRDPLWTDKTASEATGGEATETFEADGVAFDSRQVGDRDLFVALKGEETDGHRFVSQAFAKGASAAMVDHRPEDVTQSAPLLLVVDTTTGLGDLARAARKRTRARIAAVTGSVGKTGTKEALHHVLARQGLTHVSEKSFNNHVGTPLSLARMPQGAAYGVFEVGTNAPGEIAPLAELVRPHVALITTVAAVHIGNFASESAIAEEKACIFDGLEPGGVALINGDNAHADRLARRAAASPAGSVVSFGKGAACDHRLLALEEDDAGSTVTASIAGRDVTYRLAMAGAHLALNSVGVLAVVHHLGGDVAKAAADLGGMAQLPGRGARSSVAVDGGTVTVLDESYNASPVALRAALAVLARTQAGPGGRRIAVLGDMLELGDGALACHTGLVGDLIQNKVDLLFAVGPMMNRLYGELPPARRGGAAGDARAMTDLLGDVLRPGDVVLIKGSRRIGLETVVEALVSGATAAKARKGG
jgi:UDP-N-acetylmuramoyl-tripeptide--D-alanyl-D-alanine ligase